MPTGTKRGDNADDDDDDDIVLISCTFSVVVHIIIANLGEISTLDETIKTAFSKVL